MLHSGDRAKVLQEVARVLKPGGEFVLTDLMQADSCPRGVPQPILDRLLLEDSASPGYHREIARRAGIELIEYENLTPHLATHYRRVLEDTLAIEAGGDCVLDHGYVERAKKGLGHWIDGANRGWLAWGVFHFRRSAE